VGAEHRDSAAQQIWRDLWNAYFLNACQASNGGLGLRFILGSSKTASSQEHQQIPDKGIWNLMLVL